MGILKQVWVKDIKEQLLEGVEFASRATNHDALVSNEIVNIPQSGGLPGVEKNRTDVFTEAVKRTDTIKTYPVDSYSTDPMVIRNIDELQTSYAKRKSVLQSHMNTLNDRLGKEILTAWAEGLNNTVSTTGANDASALAPSATGERKRLVLADIRKLAQTLDNQKGVPSMGRVLVLPVDMYYQLFEDVNLINRNMMDKATLPKGVIDQLFGFDIYVKPTVVRVTGGGALKNVTTAGAATDQLGALAYHPDFVARALGSTKVFENNGDALRYGDVLSAEVALGASKLYTNGTGIVTLTQDAAAV